MAESFSIVLEFLRQHNFERAEEALLLELQARQFFARPAQNLDKPELAAYTEAFCENSHRDGRDKVMSLSYTERSNENSHKDAHIHANKSTFQDLQSKPPGDAPERCGSIAMQCNQLHGHTEWEFKSCSNQDCVLEFKKQGAQSSTLPFESRVYFLKNGMYDGGHHSANEAHNENGMDRMKSIKGHQIKKRELLVKSGNSMPQRPVFSQEQYQDMHFRNDSLHQRTCERPSLQANSLENVLHAARQTCKDDCFQQTLGAFDLKECAVVHEPSEIADKAAYEVKAHAPQRNVQSFANSAYNAFTESSWLDYGIPDGDVLKSSRFTQPYFLPFPASEGFEQQEEKQVVHDCVDYLKALGLQNQTYQTQFFKDMKLPWEVDLQIGFAEEEGLVNERRTQDFFTVPSSSSASTNAEFYLTKASADDFGVDKILDGQSQVHSNVLFEPTFNLGSFLDIPVGQEIALPGDKHENGIGHLSVCGNVMQNTPELLSGFATLSDEPTDHGVGYSKDYYGSDTYEDDEDPGYERQLIEDEDWFLAHEVNYPSDDEKAKLNIGKVADPNLSHSNKGGQSIQEKEDSCLFSGELFSNGSHVVSQAKPVPDISNITILLGKSNLNNELTLNQIGKMSYDGHLIDAEELKMMRSEPVWQGLDSQIEEYVLQEIEERDCKSQKVYLKGPLGCISAKPDRAAEGSNWGRASLHEDGTQNYSVPGMMPSHNHQTMHSAEFINHGGGLPSYLTTDLLFGAAEEANLRSDCSHFIKDGDASPRLTTLGAKDIKDHNPGPAGFSLSAPLSNHAFNPGNVIPAWTEGIAPLSQHSQDYGDGVLRSEAKLAVQKQEILEPSHITSSETRDEGLTFCYDNSVNELVVDDGEISAVQENLQLMKAEEDEFEIFSLRIIHRKNRTGFEEKKHFQVEINSVVAGRYLITEYLGSAAFSKAVQARDLQTGMDVCMKIIKNNKDFFDQSLDEIKLLKYINKNDPADKHHVLRLYDYFYHREHLFIVCELLRANLYEFHKFNRESGGEAYFTMPRLQSITRQCLEALEFLHCLGLIHCDLKPENILIKSYSRCEIKVIDLGSSCFQTDHLCSYVQSRSYRAPEVILGLPYDQKIDIWSLGCILAELCSGNVLFQNDSLATLLARVVGIIGPIVPDMIFKGREAHKYFTKKLRLYERNQDSNKLEYLVPKRSSLSHRLPTGDQGFVDFVGYLLQINPENRPSASEALKHPWLTYPYEPVR